MTLAALLAVVTLPVAAQVVTLPAGPPRPDAWVERTAGSSDSQLHSNVLTLIELTGDKERMQTALPKVLREGKAKMMEAAPSLDPRFGVEWEKRMAARINLDDFLGVVARVYEKHFTSDEVAGLIGAINAKKEGKPARASAQLEQKYLSEMPAMMGEVVGGTTELAAKLSMQVAQEIAKEHPEYQRRPPGRAQL